MPLIIRFPSVIEQNYSFITYITQGIFYEKYGKQIQNSLKLIKYEAYSKIRGRLLINK